MRSSFLPCPLSEPVSDTKKRFGESVRWWRKQLGITQKELAHRAGLHRSYICGIERGARNISLENIERLSRALEISMSTLFFYGDVQTE